MQKFLTFLVLSVFQPNIFLPRITKTGPLVDMPCIYQGMCLMTPTRINRAATKAASTAQVSHEIFDALDFSSPVSVLDISSPF
jgi:hypothetical protein